MSCIDCLKNCPQIISDKCIETTHASDAYPLLGICEGDSLFTVEKIILDKLTELLTGEGIVLSEVDLTTCPELVSILAAKDPTLSNIIQILWDNQCTLKEAITVLQGTPYAFNVSCLTGLPVNPTKDDILQAALTQLCSIKTLVDALPTTYVKISDLSNLVTQIINTNNAGVPKYKDRMVPYAVMAYTGPLSNFDNTGKGLVATGFDKIYLCNGLNGTPDMRGRVAVGAVANVPGGALDSEVAQSNPNNIQNVNYQLNEKFGKNFHKLSTQETPSHVHTITDPGHIHPAGRYHTRKINYGNENSTPVLQKNAGGQFDTVDVDMSITKAFTGISVNPAGNDQPHENRQPSIATYWIIYIP